MEKWRLLRLPEGLTHRWTFMPGGLKRSLAL